MLINFEKVLIIICVSILVTILYIFIKNPIFNRNYNLNLDDLKELTITKNKLTVATGTPGYDPWVIDNKPENGKGFESAIIYAIANNLGYKNEDVVWIRTTFDEALQPGKKNFDINIQQFSITEDRKKYVDLSDSYYTTNQAIVSRKNVSIDTKNISLNNFKSFKIGATVGTKSLDTIVNIIKPTQAVEFKDNQDAVSALNKNQIDALVVDLPTAFYLSNVEINDGIILGQIDTKDGDNFGLVLEKNSKKTKYINKAIENLKSDGTLKQLEDIWLVTHVDAPYLTKLN